MLRACFFLLFFIPYTLLMSIAAIVGTLAGGGIGFGHGCARLWSRGGLFLAGAKLVVSGEERIPPGEPVIFMGNHQGNFDILALSLAIPRQFSWIAKEELFRVPIFGAAMRRAGYIPLDRGHGRKAVRSMNEAADRVKGGVSVVVFPEGTRTLDGSLLPFKRGGFLLACRAGVPVVPFTIRGSREINPRNRLHLTRGTISIRFGAPISTENAGKDAEALMERVRSAILAGFEE